MANFTFGLENELPSVLFEINTGYSLGIDLPGAVPLEAKLVYPFNWFGFTIEGGALFFDDIGYHLLLGPTFFVINNVKMRLPITLGFNITGTNKNNSYYGIGGIASFNYVITKNMYFGINLEINYNFNNPYEEIAGYRDAAIGVDEEGNKIYPLGPGNQPIKFMPMMETKDHFGNYIHIKPTIGIGMQF
jgi:hypothetical protein